MNVKKEKQRSFVEIWGNDTKYINLFGYFLSKFFYSIFKAFFLRKLLSLQKFQSIKLNLKGLLSRFADDNFNDITQNDKKNKNL